MKFIHIADVHLGAEPDKGFSWSSNRKQERQETFNQVLREAKTRQVDFLLIAGDLFHRQPSLGELKELNYQFQQLKPVEVIVMAGNHDYISGEAKGYLSMQWANNVHVFKSEKPACFHFQKSNTYIYGLSYMRKIIEEPLYNKMKPLDKQGCHILLAHGGDATHVPLDFNTLVNAGFDYAALGHIHFPGIFNEGKVAYAGALEPIDKNEKGPHGFIFGQWDGTRVQVQFEPLAKREYKSITVEVHGQMPGTMIVDQVRQLMESKGYEHIYKVTLSGFFDPDIKKDYEAIYKLGQVVDVIDETQPDYDFDAIYAENKDNIIGMYIEKVRDMSADNETKDKALYYGLWALFQTMEGRV